MTSSAAEGLELRPVTRADLAACAEVFYKAIDELYARHRRAPLPRNAPAMEQLFGHLIDTDPERAWLAAATGQVDRAGSPTGQSGTGEPGIEGRAEPGTIAAFGLAALRDRYWYLSFLFVRPRFQGSGVGRRLLERCLPKESRARAPDWTGDPLLGVCVESIQPVSTALYARYGMAPREPWYGLLGEPSASARLPALPAGVEGVAFDDLASQSHERLVELIGELDLAFMGFARPADHRHYRQVDRRGVLYRDPGLSGRPIGYGYLASSGRVGPVGALDPELLPGIVGDLIRRTPAAGAISIIVPGVADRTLVGLLRAGYRIDGHPAIYCATRPGPVFERYLPGGYALP